MEGVHPPLLGSPGLLRGMLPAYEDIITVAGKELSDPSVAEAMDAADDLAPLRAHFHIPPRDKAASASAGAHGAAASSSSSPGDVAGGEARTECIYLCGNSLGLQPRGVARYIEEELAKWRDVGASPRPLSPAVLSLTLTPRTYSHLPVPAGVEGHFTGVRPWLSIDEVVRDSSARLVGALSHEVRSRQQQGARRRRGPMSFPPPHSPPRRRPVSLRSS
jgi:kynureninase